MTPDLRGFQIDADTGDIGGHDPVSAVLDALGQVFGVVTEPGAPGSGARQHTWLDTFDWRLNRAGLILEYEHKNRGGLLLLSKDNTPWAEQPVTSFRPTRPRLAADLPAGPVRDQILKLASPRALLPMATASGSVSVTRLLNADGKTVARLLVDRSTVTRADQVVPLPPRLTIAEVRGYPGQARRAARLLAGIPGVAPARQTGFLDALHALGRHPNDYSNGVPTEITARMPASVAVATLLLGLLDTLEQNVDGTLRDIDTEFLHDLRVSVRRTRSAIKLLGDVLPDTGQYAAEFKWLGDMTTPIRDLDVHLLGFDAMAAQLVAAAPADLEPFRAFLARRRVREFRRLAAVLRSARFRALTDHWRKTLTEVRDAGRPRKGPTADELAVSRTGRMFRRVAAQGGAITAASAPESLHDLRKRCKELRYVLEFFAPLHDPVAYRKVVGDLKQLQDCLGEFQDSEVQRHEIGALADAMLAERAAPAATLLAMGEIAANLALSQAEARADFAERFARFGGPAGQQRVRTLLSRPVQ
ncbi:MAG TPA: CHAD domain-containing protein [Streptosporangiaceae bacterium]|nr:CHAD domain-containing protein [Streptosporangiaceae bacterium]